MKVATLSSARGLGRGLLTGILTLGLLATVGFAGNDRGDNDGAAPGGGSSGGIGTVPDLGGQGGQGGISGLPLQNATGVLPGLKAPLKPALRLVGSYAELDSIIARTYTLDGTGWFNLQPVPGSSQPALISIDFYGNTFVELDRVAFAHSGVSVELSVSPNFAGGVAVLAAGRERRAIQSLSTGTLNLKLRRLVQAGLGDPGLKLMMKNQQGAKASLRIASDPSLIRLQLSH